MSAPAQPDFLAAMAASSEARVRQARSRESEGMLSIRARAQSPARRLTLAKSGFDLIAEFKPRSPSAGVLARDGETAPAAAAKTAMIYSSADAAAVSVLTEPASFGGSLAHLESAARASTAPVLRKDFLVDPYQVIEARAAGAAGVLLIVRLVNASVLDEMRSAADELGLFTLLEAFDAPDLERIASSLSRFPPRLPPLVGVNARDLASLRLKPARLRDLASSIPASAIRVAESGLNTAEDAASVARSGYRLALVGSALMRSLDPAALIRGMLEAGRSASAEGSS